MKIRELYDKLKDISKKPFFPKLLILLGVTVMLLILLCDFSEDKKNNKQESEAGSVFITSESYSAELEEKLSEMLSEIEGVGKSKVMVNLSSTEEYVYAEEVKSGKDRSESSLVIVDKGSGKGALVKKLYNPQISGIVIVCEGGDDPKICEKVYKAVSVSLNIPANRIYVAEMK